MDSRQLSDEGPEQGLSASPDIMDELEECQVQRQRSLGVPAVRSSNRLRRPRHS